MLTAAESGKIASIITAVIIPVTLFIIGKSVDVLIQFYFKRQGAFCRKCEGRGGDKRWPKAESSREDAKRKSVAGRKVISDKEITKKEI